MAALLLLLSVMFLLMGAYIGNKARSDDAMFAAASVVAVGMLLLASAIGVTAFELAAR